MPIEIAKSHVGQAITRLHFQRAFLRGIARIIGIRFVRKVFIKEISIPNCDRWPRKYGRQDALAPINFLFLLRVLLAICFVYYLSIIRVGILEIRLLYIVRIRFLDFLRVVIRIEIAIVQW